MFKTYITSKNEEFLETMKAENKRWSQGKQPANYQHLDTMKMSITMYICFWSKRSGDLPNRRKGRIRKTIIPND